MAAGVGTCVGRMYNAKKCLLRSVDARDGRGCCGRSSGERASGEEEEEEEEGHVPLPFH